MPAGRPKLYTNPEDMARDIDLYFEDCIEREAVFTIEGLAYWLDMDRKSVLNYSKDKEFFPTLKKAKAKILQQLIELSAKGGYNATMAIFNLKNNYGFKDKTETENTHKHIMSEDDMYKDMNSGDS